MNDEKFYLQYSCKNNRVDAPDGEYLLKDRNSDWTYLNVLKKVDPRPYIELDWYSKSKVIVRGGLVDIATLEDCYREIQSQHNYHGRFIDSIRFDGKYINIGMGS
tara:strand:- start:90 stop:404 length:315 start_codon:yes stop_codon:yes gene_type:complete